MPRKLDLSDRYARRAQNRARRRLVAPAPADQAGQPVSAVEAGPEAAPSPIAVAPRTFARPRPTPVTSYHYIRADLIRIAVVISILLVLMAVLFVILR